MKGTSCYTLIKQTSHYEKVNGRRKLKGATSLKELLTQKIQPSLKKSENAWVLWSEYSKNLSPEEVEKEVCLSFSLPNMAPLYSN